MFEGQNEIFHQANESAFGFLTIVQFDELKLS